MKPSNTASRPEAQPGHKARLLADPRILKAALEHERLLLDTVRKQKQAHFRHRKLLRLAAHYKASLPQPEDEVDFDRLEDLTDFDYRLQFADELPAYIRHR